MKNYTEKSFLFLVVIIVLLEGPIIFMLDDKVLLTVIISIINLIVFLMIYAYAKEYRFSQQEKIQKISAVIEKDLIDVVNKTPVGLIKFNPETNDVEWLNKIAQSLFSEHQVVANDVEKLRSLDQGNKRSFEKNNRIYEFYIDEQFDFIVITDITSIHTMEGELVKNQTAIGVISIDNYLDVIEHMDEHDILQVKSFITSLISAWLGKYAVFYKKISDDRYIFIGHLSDVHQMKKEKFSILDKVRIEASKKEMALTVSMGISYENGSVNQIGAVAQTNLDIALVRGGDQVVIKKANDEAKPVFYGGKSESAIRRTRVRSRAMSTAIQGILKETDDVYIMGHRFPDMDALGSAFGMAKLIKLNQKEVKIIVDTEEISEDINRVLLEVKKYPEVNKLIVSPREAINKISRNSLLIMVDYHRPSLSISTRAYKYFEKVIIIDHHRRGDEYPTHPLLSYIETSASSASELVTELIEYQSGSKQLLNKFEATILLAGIIIDTKSFSIRTTSRTFDAASYLRSCGADISLVQYLLSTDLNNFLEVSQLIAKSEYITPEIIVVVGDENKEYSSVTTAKVADTLLSMSGITAAFVMTKRIDGLIGVSARSDGSMNVQRTMEQLGGGGHFTNATAQIKAQSLLNDKNKMLEIINNQLLEE